MSRAILDESDADRDEYARLLAETVPTVVRTEEENDRLLAEIGRLLDKGQTSLATAEARLLDLLSVLVEQFEEHACPIRESTPQETLAHLMEQHGLDPSDLLDMFGTEAAISRVLDGHGAISRAQARKLAVRFGVSEDLFS